MENPDKAAARIAALEAALRQIANGKGEYATCGALAEGEGAGVTACDCENPTWQPCDARKIARKALE